MVNPILQHPEDRPPVELTAVEWSEVLDCLSALHTCFHKCGGLEGDESIELVRSVYFRLSRAVTRINARLEGE